MMKTKRILLAALALSVLLASCQKDHYDVSNVHGVNAEGEVLLPLVSASVSVRDMMERFKLMDMVSWNADGNLALHFGYDVDSAVTGDKMLRFKDLDYHEHFSYENPFPGIPLPYTDTVLRFERTITFESEHVFVKEARMKSGRMDFRLDSNVGNVRHVVLRSSNIKTATGQDFELDIPVQANTFGFDLEGLRYTADEANTLEISYEIRINVTGIFDPELFVDVRITGRDLAFSEMRGFVEEYGSRNRMDTVFSLFPNELDGMIEVDGVRVKVSERNTFNLGARFILDTVTVTSEQMPPFSVFDPLPLTVELPPSVQYVLALDKTVDGKISANGGRLLTSGEFIVNPAGFSQLVNVSDTSRIDLRADVEFPFSFTVDDVTYLDTLDFDLSQLEKPDMIEQFTLELTVKSFIPLNLDASFFLYDSVNDRITDVLLDDASLIEASFDGRPTVTTLTINVDENRMENLLHSDHIIMSYQLDSGSHNVDLNINQRLDLFLKGKAKYKGNLDFKN